MNQPATISPLSIVPAKEPAPVKPMLTAEEKQFLDLLADIVVADIIKTTKQKEAS